jgi:hypothetical protein
MVDGSDDSSHRSSGGVVGGAVLIMDGWPAMSRTRGVADTKGG